MDMHKVCVRSHIGDLSGAICDFGLLQDWSVPFELAIADNNNHLGCCHSALGFTAGYYKD